MPHPSLRDRFASPAPSLLLLLLLLLCAGVVAGVAPAQIRPPAVQPPTLPAGAGSNPAVLVDAKVPLVASIDAPLQVPAGEPFQVVVRLQQADVAQAYLAGGCTVRIQGREFPSPGFGELQVQNGKRARSETIEVHAPSVGPLDIEVVPFTAQGPKKAVGAKVVRKCTVTSESPMRRGGHDGRRDGGRLVLTEPVPLDPACSFDGRALFVLVGTAAAGWGVARFDTATGAETAYLPLANFQRGPGRLPAVTYERRGNRVYVAVHCRTGNSPPTIQVLDLDADTLAVRRVVRSGPLRWSTGANSFVDDQGLIAGVFSGRDGLDVAVTTQSQSPTNAATVGAICWFDLQQNECTFFDLVDSLAVAAGNPGLAGATLRLDTAVMSAPLAAGRSPLLHLLTMGPTVRIVETAGSAARHFTPPAIPAGSIAPRVEAIAGVSGGRLLAVTDRGLAAYALDQQPPAQVGAILPLPNCANGRAFRTTGCLAAVNAGRVVVAGRDGVASWQLADGAVGAVDASMVAGAGVTATMLAVMPTTPNQVVVQVDLRADGQPAGPALPAEFAFVLLK